MAFVSFRECSHRAEQQQSQRSHRSIQPSFASPSSAALLCVPSASAPLPPPSPCCRRATKGAAASSLVRSRSRRSLRLDSYAPSFRSDGGSPLLANRNLTANNCSSTQY
uniref:DUF4005 domain-containing protein n=1 Tax=Leersia perrieri TaxID=77586 RepID=A0A0D9XC91_9ORYZ